MSQNRMLWLALSGVAAACPSLFCCFMGFTTMAGATTYTTEYGGTSATGTMNPAMGAVFLCLGLLPWLLPAGVWFYTRKKEDVDTAGDFGLKPGQPYPSPWDDEG